MIHPFIPYLVLFGFASGIAGVGILSASKVAPIEATTLLGLGWAVMNAAVITFTWDVLELLT